jgi:hypothetical protein
VPSGAIFAVNKVDRKLANAVYFRTLLGVTQLQKIISLPTKNCQQKKRRPLRCLLFFGVKIIGGGGGNRTRVRKSSALGSTCLAHSIVFNFLTPEGQGDKSAIP